MAFLCRRQDVLLQPGCLAGALREPAGLAAYALRGDGREVDRERVGPALDHCVAVGGDFD